MKGEHQNFLYDTRSENLLDKHGVDHEILLKKGASKIKERFSDPELHSDKTQTELDAWADEHSEEVRRVLEEVFIIMKELKSTHSPGHDISHLMDNCNSALRIFKEYNNLSESEKLEVVLGCLGHDLGRYFEKNLNTIDRDVVLYLAPYFLGRRMEPIRNLPEKLRLRILYNIASPAPDPTNHRTADTVVQCDREQLMGSTTIARDLAYDVILTGRRMSIPKNGKYSFQLPMADSEDDKSMFLQMEFLMRNVYPPTSPYGLDESNRHKQETAVILMLATEGMSDLYKQVFSPELSETDAQPSHWSKKCIPITVFNQAREEKDKFLRAIPEDTHTTEEVLDAIMKSVSTDKIAVPPTFKDHMRKELESYTAQEIHNLWMVVEYALSKRHQRRINDLQRLEDEITQGGVTGIVAGWVKTELEERENIFSSYSTTSR